MPMLNPRSGPRIIRTPEEKAAAKREEGRLYYQEKIRADPKRAAHNREVALAYYRAKIASEDVEAFRKRIQTTNAKQHIARPWKMLLAGAILRARKKGLPCDIDSEWAKARWTGRCEITGVTFAKNPAGPKAGPWPFSASIDRINPALGYTKANSIFVANGLNNLKSCGTFLDAFVIAQAFVKAVESTGLPPEFGVQTLVARALHGA